ncbi:MAG: DNA polymerase III subunit delta [Burkholderiales bacterium]|nr:DNA polymerase III subunit delta [Burkholderiales bacterium]
MTINLINSKLLNNNLFVLNVAEDYYCLTHYLLTYIQQQRNVTTTYRFNAERGFKFDEITDLTFNQELFSNNILIELIYKTKPVIEQQKEILNLINRLNATTTFVVICDKFKTTDFNSNWVKTIEKSGAIVSINDKLLPEIISHELKQHKLNIDKSALDLLLQLNLGNIDNLMQEIKRFSYLYDSQHTITLKNIHNESASNAIYSIYNLNSAYLEGKLATTLTIFNNIFQQPEDAILILWLIHEDLKKILKIKSLLHKKISQQQISRDLKIYNTKPYFNLEQRLKFSEIIDILNDLSIIDMTIKGIMVGNVHLQLIDLFKKLCNKK